MPIRRYAPALFLGALLAAGSARAVDQTPLPAASSLKTSVVDYRVPELSLIRDDGRKVSTTREFDDGRPVFMNFIFTSCPGICPLLSESFRQLQIKLGDERSKVHMVSISIDPEEDTPRKLREYADRFRAGPQWQHYTGTVAASLAMQRAFGVYNGDKMSHAPVTFFRASPSAPWTQLKGFATANDLVRAYEFGITPLVGSR
jgi:protein SCO1